MKKILSITLAMSFFSCMLGINEAKADLYVQVEGTFVDVGSYDSFIDSAVNKTDIGGNGDQDELNWINNTLQTLGYETEDFTLADFNKTDDLENSPLWLPVYSEIYPSATLAVPESYAFKLASEVEYFFIKTGNNNSDPDYRYFLFANNENLEYAVFMLEAEGYYIKNVGALSHIDEIGEVTDPKVPEPATMLLFGTGLAVFAGFTRRRRS